MFGVSLVINYLISKSGGFIYNLFKLHIYCISVDSLFQEHLIIRDYDDVG